MEGFITFLLFFFLFMWLLKRLFPLLLTWWIKRKVSNGSFGGGVFGGTPFGKGEDFSQEQQKRDEGKVTITQVPKQEKVIDKEVGEYIDFEEK